MGVEEEEERDAEGKGGKAARMTAYSDPAPTGYNK